MASCFILWKEVGLVSDGATPHREEHWDVVAQLESGNGEHSLAHAEHAVNLLDTKPVQNVRH